MIRNLPALIGLALKQLTRHRVRSLLTVLGVAMGMFLFATVETMQRSLREATEISADDTTLVVYRENRFCPATSRLPEHYESQIRKIEGVKEVIPIQIVVNNCGASLDVIAFRGVPPDSLERYAPQLNVESGSIGDWKQRSDAALLGKHFAARRGLKVGDRFDAAGVTVSVAGIIESDQPQDNNVAYVHLDFLQQASRAGLGIVTQFNVRADSSNQLNRIAEEIDATFATDQQPTSTRPEKAFFAQTASELIELVGFTRWLGIGAVAAVLGLVANAVLLVVRGRVKENAVLQTLGYPQSTIGVLVAIEGVLLGLAGGVVGVAGAFFFLTWQSYTIGNEGLTMSVVPDSMIVVRGLAVAFALGLLASLYPAWQASRVPIVHSLRAS
ncbi:MAG: putative ABC transport system permease protein [Verrucomicrobiales bacterium]|jgi:putative ABC transport system permease protein